MRMRASRIILQRMYTALGSGAMAHDAVSADLAAQAGEVGQRQSAVLQRGQAAGGQRLGRRALAGGGAIVGAGGVGLAGLGLEVALQDVEDVAGLAAVGDPDQ